MNTEIIEGVIDDSIEHPEVAYYIVELEDDTGLGAPLKGPFEDLPSAEDYLRLAAQSTYTSMLEVEGDRGVLADHADDEWIRGCMIVQMVKRVSVNIHHRICLAPV